MRNVLFKAKHLGDGNWVEGYYVESLEINEKELYGFIFPLDGIMDWSDGFYDWEEIDKETLCEFTGIYDRTKWDELSEAEQIKWLEHFPKDKWKGKPIFENDIIQSRNGHIGYVTFKHGHFRKECKCHPNDLLAIGDIYGVNEKVIGNIFDNTDLLEQSKAD